MQTALRNRRDQDNEEGFTLIELMVVVLIIGILLAIAIPTFLGARDRANNRSAQSNLRNALTAEKVLYTDNQQYTDTSPAGIIDLKGVEPSLTWAPAVSATSARQVVAKTFGAVPTTVVLYDQSATGTCWYIGDVSAPAPNPGTYYEKDSKCTATSVFDPSTNGAPAGSTTASVGDGKWATAF
jgi:type IV pilus assembly protein PilA